MSSRLAEGIHRRKFRHSAAPENRVKRPERLIVATLTKLAGFHGKAYSFPSQSKILELLLRWYGVGLSKRTLCRHMNALEATLYVSRTRRIEYRRGRGLMFRSTIYAVRRRYLSSLQSQMIAAVKSIAASSSSTRVPDPAKYLRDFLENLSYAARLSTTGPPRQARSRPPRTARGQGRAPE